MKKEYKNGLKDRILETLTLQKQIVLVLIMALLIAGFSFLVLLPQILKPFYESNIYDYLYQPANNIQIDRDNFGKDISYIIKTKNGATYVSNSVNDMFGQDVKIADILNNITSQLGKFQYKGKFYYYVVAVREQTTNIVFTNDKLLKSQERSLIGIILPVMVTTTLIIMLLIFAWSNRLVYKIKRLKRKTESIAKGKLVEGEHFLINDEFNILSKAIDETAKSLKEKEEYKNYMFQNLSHELKTPIAVIDSYIEGISDGVIDKEEGLKVIEEQTGKLKNQVKTLLYFNKIDYMKEQTEYTKQKIDILDVIKQSVESHKLQRTDIEWVVITKHKNTSALGNEEMWQTIVDNILNNFVRYSKTKIVITICQNRIEFFNDGEHIDEDVIKNIFSPYIKGNKGQTGLGLAIVKRTLDIFGYNIEAKNIEQGVIFNIEKMQIGKRT
ncbi:MAG: HAMP domain-containing histidine kinase [Clostridia bacterium]|nr:HAMP domain-containing histidine kinase [Clostridia bacterium]